MRPQPTVYPRMRDKTWAIMEAEEKQWWKHSMKFDKSNIPMHHVIDKQTSNNSINGF
jgi:hypothetical protein